MIEHLAPIIAAITGLIVPVGGAIAWLWNKIEKRFTEIEKALDQCRDDSAVKLTVIELMWQEIERLSPASAVLARVKKLLDEMRSKPEGRA